jgi:hypothetical protein
VLTSHEYNDWLGIQLATKGSKNSNTVPSLPGAVNWAHGNGQSVSTKIAIFPTFHGAYFDRITTGRKVAHL